MTGIFINNNVDFKIKYSFLKAINIYLKKKIVIGLSTIQGVTRAIICNFTTYKFVD